MKPTSCLFFLTRALHAFTRPKTVDSRAQVVPTLLRPGQRRRPRRRGPGLVAVERRVRVGGARSGTRLLRLARTVTCENKKK